MLLSFVSNCTSVTILGIKDKLNNTAVCTFKPDTVITNLPVVHVPFRYFYPNWSSTCSDSIKVSIVVSDPKHFSYLLVSCKLVSFFLAVLVFSINCKAYLVVIIFGTLNCQLTDIYHRKKSILDKSLYHKKTQISW